MTEAKELPSGWSKKRLDEIGYVYSGSTPSTNVPDYWDGGIVWVTPNDLSKLNTPYISSSGRTISEKGLNGSSTHLLPPNSIVISSRAPIGYVAIPQVAFCTNQGCKSFDLHDGYSTEFVYYNLNFHIEKLKSIGEGTTFSEISKTALCAIQLPFPELKDEQQKIAAVLSCIDRAIELTETLIAKQQRLKAGLMQKLLTKGIDEHGKLRSEATHEFKDSPLGRIPVEWEVRKLADSVKAPITYGIVQAGPHVEDGVPYIRTGDMSGDKLLAGNLLRTSQRIAASFKRSEVHAGEIVFALRATVGKVLEVPEELDGANLTQGTARIAPSNILNGRFLLWAMRSRYFLDQIELSKKGTTFFEITLRDLRELKIKLPQNRYEQDKIARILSLQEDQIGCEKERYRKLIRLKTGLMQNLLTGKIRVNALLETQSRTNG